MYQVMDSGIILCDVYPPRRIVGQVVKKYFLEYLNVKFNPERAIIYLEFVRVGKYFMNEIT